MKKNYTVSLDEEAVEFIKPVLEKNGLTFSGYLNEAVKEYATAIKCANLPDDVSKLTMGEFIGMFNRMIKGMKKPVKKAAKS